MRESHVLNRGTGGVRNPSTAVETVILMQILAAFAASLGTTILAAVDSEVRLPS
jgi:hypothetical protein